MIHVPVLQEEVKSFLTTECPAVFVDATLGAGGHAELLLEACPKMKLIGIDRDGEIMSLTEKRLAKYGERVLTVRDNYRNLDAALGAAGAEKVDGFLFDLGVSSLELDSPERGFSFKYDSPLDMRMDRTQKLTAEDIVNTADETELADAIFKYGEERFSRRIAKNICSARAVKRISTTAELVDIINRSVPPAYRHGRIHPATRTFQALRIVVNDELNGLREALAKAEGSLNQGGKLAVISFHSLEDRIVKRFFVEKAKCETPSLKILTKKPVIAGDAERESNPRSRSAKLRVAEKL